MAELSFKQSENRNYIVPILIALVVVGAVFGYVYLTPHRVADITVTHTAVLPTHTVLKTESKLVGAQNEVQDVVYVMATVRIDNRSRIPLKIDDLTGAVSPPDDAYAPTTITAIQKGDLESVYTGFPTIRTMASPPLLRETTIQPGDHAEGMVLLNFPISEDDWNKRKSASVTISFYYQDPFTVTIPK
jgi:hypothetical protein